MNIQKHYDDSLWIAQTQSANDAFNSGDLALSNRLYQAALEIAKQIFIDFRHSDPVPNTLTPVLVVAYFNLADCWAAQNENEKQQECLIEIYDMLKIILNTHTLSHALDEQVHIGINKVFFEICISFKDCKNKKIFNEIEIDFAELSKFYSLDTNLIH